VEVGDLAQTIQRKTGQTYDLALNQAIYLSKQDAPFYSAYVYVLDGLPDRPSTILCAQCLEEEEAPRLTPNGMAP
jgi:hypothetical protein